MELEELKSVWTDMSEQMARQKRLTNEIILKMAHERSSSRINRIIYMEGIGAIISAIALGYILINLYKLNDWLSLAGGIATILILLISITLGGILVVKARKIDIVKNSYAQALTYFSDLKRALRLYKWVSICIYFIIPFALLPVMSTLFLNINLLDNLDEFKESLIACIIIMPLIWYVIYKIYQSNLRKISSAFNEVKDINN